jgi:hypothetical protein
MPQDDDDIFLGPEDGEVFRRDKAGSKLRLVTDADKPKPRRQRRLWDWRLPRSDKPWSRLWMSELRDHHLYPAPARLLHVLRHRAFEDRDEIELSDEIAREADIPLRWKSRIARQLENRGLIRINRSGQKLLKVTCTEPPR